MKLLTCGMLLLTACCTFVSSSALSIDKVTYRGVVQITDEKEERGGSAFAIRQESVGNGNWEIYYMTASHVVDGLDLAKAKIIYFDVYSSYVRIRESTCLTLVCKDNKMDVAVVKHMTNYPHRDILTLDKADPNIGDQIISIGCPLLLTPMFTTGYVCRKDELGYLTNAQAFMGNSGGPIVSVSTGKVIGVTIKLYRVSINGVIPHIHVFTPMSDITPWLSNYLHE